jgi:hypothetical protein
MKGSVRCFAPLLALAAASLAMCGDPALDTGFASSAGGAGPAGVTYTEAREPCRDRNPYRNVYFGDLHAHSAASIDAFGFGVRAGADAVYAFARGAPLSVPTPDASARGALSVQLKAPLDFAAISDHAEFLGETYLCTNPDSERYGSEACAQYRASGAKIGRFIASWGKRDPQRSAKFCGNDFALCYEALETVWDELRQAAERASDFTSRCEFSAFMGYEYTASPFGVMLHRNVIFRNGMVPSRPPSYFEESTLRGLREALSEECADAGDGCDVIVIPHNPNFSRGVAFAPRYPGAETIDEERAQAALRAEMEPVLEIYQNKGCSECSASFSDDRDCAFENLPFPVCAEDGANAGNDCAARLDYYREILAEGLREETRIGVNPYRLGVIGSTDTHNGTPGNTDEASFVGHGGVLDSGAETRLEMSSFGPGGLAGIWAVENSRDALFEAIERRETFATSGTRIEVRFFGGWGYPSDLCGAPDLAEIGYGRGVPMGGMLPPPPDDGARPVFVATASKDETPLDRIQVVKIWTTASGETRERVIDIAGGAGTATVNTETCVPTQEGSATLCSVWTDSDFDPELPAAYYVRVLENPTCRWTTFTCNGLTEGTRPRSCGTPQSIRERAWSSPIWFSPR